MTALLQLLTAHTLIKNLIKLKRKRKRTQQKKKKGKRKSVPDSRSWAKAVATLEHGAYEQYAAKRICVRM